MPSINSEILVDIFKELSKQTKNIPEHVHDFPKFYLSGKQPLKAFCKVLPSVKSVTLSNSWIIVSFEKFQWKMTNGNNCLPQIFWEMMVPNIQKLTINYFNEDDHMFLIKYLQNSEKLQEIADTYGIDKSIWSYLLNPNIKKLAAPLFSLIELKSNGMLSDCETIEAIIDERSAFLDFMNEFDIPCKNFIINSQISDLWRTIYDVFTEDLEEVTFPTVEFFKLELISSYDILDILQMDLSNFLQSFQIIFPNIKNVEMNIEIGEQKYHLGIISQEYFNEFVHEASTQIQRAKIKYNLQLNWSNIERIVGNQNDGSALKNTLKTLNFDIKETIDNKNFKHILDTKFSDTKSVRIIYNIDRLTLQNSDEEYCGEDFYFDFHQQFFEDQILNQEDYDYEDLDDDSSVEEIHALNYDYDEFYL